MLKCTSSVHICQIFCICVFLLLGSCRGTDGEKAVLQAIDAALSRASQADSAFSPEKKKKGNLLDESYELQRSAFMAARAALKGAFWKCFIFPNFLQCLSEIVTFSNSCNSLPRIAYFHVPAVPVQDGSTL